MLKAETKEQQEIPAPTSISDKELQDARQLFNIFNLAWKNYGLYPEDHVSTINSFKKLVAAFDNFFSTHGDLRLTVEKDRLLCGSEMIYEVTQDALSEDIITLLYRDGIKWIEFQEGLTLEEIAAFFKIAYNYRSFVEETEGDIVTALMDEELEYIDFKAVDIFWQDLLLMDFSKLPPPAPQLEELANQNETDQTQQPDVADRFQRPPEGTESGDIQARSIADPSISDAQLELTGDDYEILQQMVQEEECWDIKEDLFEVLLIILKSQSEQEKFTAVLKFISEAAVETIELDKLDLLARFFQSLRKLFSPEKLTKKDWRRPLIDRFFQDLSKPEIFELISDKLLKVQTSEIEKLKAFEQALHYFSPEVIPFLLPVMMQRSSPEIQQMVSSVIVHQSRRDLGPLEKIAEQHGTEMGDKLLGILNRLQGDRVNKILFKLCYSSSVNVRRKAIRELAGRDPKYVIKLFSLVDDPSKEVRASIIEALAKQKSIALENMLLNYLRGNYAQKDSAHILACYKALGRCGSKGAVPFLRRILLSRGWNSFIGSGKSTFREGAAIALALLDTPEAGDVLKKASKSRYKVIRKAFDRAKTVRDVAGENIDD